MASSIYTCSITLSDFTKKRIPDLNRILEGIKDQRYKLEIVGVLKVAGGSEDVLAVTVKTAVPTVIEPASDQHHSGQKIKNPPRDILGPNLFSSGQEQLGSVHQADQTSVENNYYSITESTVSSLNGKPSSKSPVIASDQEQCNNIMSPTEEKQLVDELQDAVSSSNKNKHTFYHFMHGKVDKSCPFIDQSEKNCDSDYQPEFARGLKALLEGHENEPPVEDYTYYIHDHLKNHCNSSPCCSKLWEYCVTNKIHSALKYATEGLVLFSVLNESMIGKVTTKYAKYKDSEKMIGHGGSGKVYKLTSRLVVKEEQMRPLITSNPTIFKQVMKLECKHVIPLLEYIVGESNDQDSSKHVFLSVMPYMNRRSLDRQFTTYKCVLDYMINFKDEEQCIFRNYIVMFTHVFEGLKYLHGQKIVHGDVKDKNILVHQTCACDNPLLCSCPYGGRVTYVLGDMGLFWIDNQQLTGEYVEWAKEKYSEPAGTDRMKASELYFTDQQGGKCGSIKVDIWAGGVTIMKALVGDDKINKATEEIDEYLESISFHSSRHVHNIGKAHQIAKELKKELSSSEVERLKGSKDYVEKFNTIIQLLASGDFLKHAKWMSSYTRPERLPLPYILGAVHSANSLHKQCLDKLPEVYSTPLWKTMEKVMEIIKNSVRLLPGKRLDASDIIEQLKACSL